MSQNQIKSLIKLTNFKRYAENAFDNPINTLSLLRRIAADYQNCVDLQAELYEKGCFKDQALMREFESAETQMALYKLILAELPKYL